MAIRRRTATVAGVAALAGGAVTATVFSLLPASAADYHDAAFGIHATGGMNIAQRPYVTSTSGAAKSSSLDTYESPDGTLSVSGATASVGANHSDASVSSVTYINGMLKVQNAKASCKNGVATPGEPVVTISPQLKNVQVQKKVVTKNSDGTVTATSAVITIKTVDGSASTLQIASATCGNVGSTPPPTTAPPTTAPPTGPTTAPPTGPTTAPPTTAPPTGPAPTTPPAPVPTATPTHLPVTG